MEHASGNAAPMTTVARSFTTAKIGQSVSGVGQQNTLSITVQANFDLQVGSVCVLGIDFFRLLACIDFAALLCAKLVSDMRREHYLAICKACY